MSKNTSARFITEAKNQVRETQERSQRLNAEEQARKAALRTHGAHILKLLTPELFTPENGASLYAPFIVQGGFSSSRVSRTLGHLTAKRQAKELGIIDPEGVNGVLLSSHSTRSTIHTITRDILIGEPIHAFVLGRRYGRRYLTKLPETIQNKCDRVALITAAGSLAVVYDPQEGMTTCDNRDKVKRLALEKWSEQSDNPNTTALVIGSAEEYLRTAAEPNNFISGLEELVIARGFSIEPKFSHY